MRVLCFFTAVVSCVLWTAQAVVPYYGKLISSDWGANSSPGLSGEVYAVDDDSFQIIDFVLDPQAGNAVFHLGTDKTYDAARDAGGPDASVEVISNPLGTGEVLGSYNGQRVLLTLKGAMSLSDVTYIAIFSRDTNSYLGGMDLPSNFEVPAPVNVGQFSERAHQVRSGDVIVLDDRTIKINNLRYDGQGPDAFFYVGITDRVQRQSPPYGKIPDENGIIDQKAKAYSDRDIVLTLPEGISVTNLKWLSIYCIQYRHNFGEVFFPSNLNVPPSTEIKIDRAGVNCEALSDNLQVSWTVDGDSINFELAGNIDQTTDYMAFGLSGSDSTYSMFNADVVVTDWIDAEARAVDYKITGYSQCAANGGACPDESPSNGGMNNAMMPSAELTNGIVRIRYKRALVTGDDNDKDYKVDGTAQQIVWAVGPLNTKKEAAKHYGPSEGGRINAAKTIDFGREAVDNCPAFKIQAEVEKPKFQAHHLYGDQEDAFTFEIGQAGSEQGYKAITGNPSWGIAWYVNGILVPELHLKRGVEYTFLVGGGDDTSEGSMYHPLYVTSDVLGGRAGKPNSTETIYPGMVNGILEEYAVGGYCEWKLTNDAIDAADMGKVYQCFEEFQDDLILECAPNSAGYTTFKWTPTADTPSTVYYQCYTHENLGWKINVYDEYPEVRKVNPGPCANSAVSTSISYLLLAICLAFFY